MHSLNSDPITVTTNADFVIEADGFTFLVRIFIPRPFLTLPSSITVWRAIVWHIAIEKLPFPIAKEVCDADFRFGSVCISQFEIMWLRVCFFNASHPRMHAEIG